MALQRNGLLKWLITIATALLISFSGWITTSVISQGAKIAAVEATQEMLSKWLERIEEKLDRVIGEK